MPAASQHGAAADEFIEYNISTVAKTYASASFWYSKPASDTGGRAVLKVKC
jgi:hypothetical protein